MDIFQLVSFKLNSQITPEWMLGRLLALPEWFWQELEDRVVGWLQELEKENYELCLCAAYLRFPTQGPIESIVKWSMDNLKSLGYHFVDEIEADIVEEYQTAKYKEYGGLSDMCNFRDSGKKPLTGFAQGLADALLMPMNEGLVAGFGENLQFFDLVNTLRREVGRVNMIRLFGWEYSFLDRIPMGFFMQSTKQMDFMNWNDSPFN